MEKNQSNGREIALYMINLMRNELDTPGMRGFREINRKLNELADDSPHISYRFKDDETGDGLAYRLYPDHPLIISQLIVAPAILDILAFGMGEIHTKVKKVFGPKYFDQEKLKRLFPYTQALFYVDKGQTPHLEEGKAKLEQLIKEGPSEEVFTFSETVSSIPLRPHA